MSFFNRLFGYPDGDPSGRNRALFRKIGSKAAHTFIAERNPTKAAETVEAFAASVAEQCGEFHPDIGRSLLLSAIFLTMLAKYEQALETTRTAQELLEPLGRNDYDLQAARFLSERLEAVVAGTQDQSVGPIIARGTPPGDFLFDLKS